MNFEISQENYFFESESTVHIQFNEKYFPGATDFNINYVLTKDGSNIITNEATGKHLDVTVQDNGVYQLEVNVSCHQCINTTFKSEITLKKLFDLSNTDIITTIGAVLSLGSGYSHWINISIINNSALKFFNINLISRIYLRD